MTANLIAIAAAWLAIVWALWPRRSLELEQLRRRELADIEACFSGREKLTHLGRPEILAILNDRGERERRHSDICARALRLERQFHRLDRRRVAIAAADRRRRAARAARDARRRSAAAAVWYAMSSGVVSLGRFFLSALERGIHSWH